VQAVTPDEFRGRVNAADYLVGAGGGQLGSLEAGLVGSLTTPVISALSGGLLTIAGAVAIGAALPGFRRYRDAASAESAAPHLTESASPHPAESAPPHPTESAPPQPIASPATP
jgi:predicted lipid-binding transport protein (Tim44 family)